MLTQIIEMETDLEADSMQQDTSNDMVETGSKVAHTKPKKRETKGQPSYTREGGKSGLPFSKVQKIVKADKDLPMVAKEAIFLISVATEEFIKRVCEASQRIAARERRTTVQQRDISMVVQKVDEFLFLDEMIGFLNSESTTKQKSKTSEQKEQQRQPGAATLLDNYMVEETAQDADSAEDVVMNEDGTMSLRQT